MYQIQPKNDIFPIFMKLPCQNIAQLKLMLESYEGLGILRTLSAERGEVVILALKDTHKIVLELVSTIETDLRLRIIAPPASARNDWLLGELLEDE